MTPLARDTNCHVERWFGIVKQSILRKQRRLRPGTFVRKMHGSLQGFRYSEHIMCHNFSEQLLLKPSEPKDITQSQEGWAQRNGATHTTAKSKFYTAPKTVPVPKRAKSTQKAEKDHQKSADEKTTRDGLSSKALHRGNVWLITEIKCMLKVEFKSL